MSTVIYHNPGCGTSRNVLAILTAAGAEPVVIDYRKEGWTRPQLLGLFEDFHYQAASWAKRAV